MGFRLLLSIFIAYLFLIFVNTAQADWVIVQEVENTGMPAPFRLAIKMKGHKTRIDVGPHGSEIRDGDSGDTIVLMHGQKEYVVQSASMKKESKERYVENISGTAAKPSERPKLIPTGRKQEISGFDTEEFVWNGTKTQVRYWISRNFPNYASILEEMYKSFREDRYRKSETFPDASELPGFPIRTESEWIVEAPPGLSPKQHRQVDTGQEKTFRSVVTLISVKEKKLDNMEFTIPAGYKKQGASISSNGKGSTKDIRKAHEAMQKPGMPESELKELKKVEQMIKDAETQKR